MNRFKECRYDKCSNKATNLSKYCQDASDAKYNVEKNSAVLTAFQAGRGRRKIITGELCKDYFSSQAGKIAQSFSDSYNKLHDGNHCRKTLSGISKISELLYLTISLLSRQSKAPSKEVPLLHANGVSGATNFKTRKRTSSVFSSVCPLERDTAIILNLVLERRKEKR